MSISAKNCVVAFVIAAVTCVINVETAEAGNGWGWAKPLNKRVGSAFYTSNRNANHGRRSSRTYSYRARSRTLVRPVYTVPVYHPPVVVPLPPTVYPADATQTVITGPVIGGSTVRSTTPVVIEARPLR